MNDAMAQLGLLAQGSDFEGWANILFVVVMAILWLLGALVKTISKKGPSPKPEGSPSPRRPQESWQELLRRKAEELQRRVEEEAGLRERPRPAGETPARTPQPPAGRVRVRTGRQGESVVVYERPQPPPTMQREHQAARQRDAQKAVATAGQYATKETAPREARVPEFEPMIGGTTGVMAERPMPLEPGKVQSSVPREAAGFEPGTILDYSDPDVLKKAILHCEILGKPLALRDPAEQQASAF
jgi:hypothetical protein